MKHIKDIHIDLGTKVLARNFCSLEIDGNHDYDFVKKDFDLFEPHVIDGGWIAFHDTIYYDGPRRVVRDQIFKSDRFADIGMEECIVYARKVKKNTISDRLHAKYIYIIHSICVLAKKAKLPKYIETIGRKVIRKIQ